MTKQQARRVAAFKRRASVKGAFEFVDGTVTIGWERPADGRDMTTIIGEDGRTLVTRPTYRYDR